MKLVKQKDEFGLKVFLKEDNKYIAVTFGCNGDLYWYFHSNDVNKDNDFVITKENYGVYQLFYQLFNDIKNINIFNEENFAISLDIDEKNKQQKYKQFNYSNYNELYNDDEKTITWYSDETAHAVANIIKIKNEKEYFKLQFYIQPHIYEYDEDFHSLYNIPIRFRNSGSSYEPFNIVFMRMYNAMKEIDDVNDIGHQLHIEEYIYNNKVKKLVK